MLFKKNLLDDLTIPLISQEWINCFLSVLSTIINFPLEIYYIFRLQMYLYYVGNLKKDTIYYSLANPNNNPNNNPLTISHKKSHSGKIICWNIQYGNSLLKLDTLEEIIKFLEDERPEIVILQEILKNEKLNQIELLSQRLGLQHSHFQTHTEFQNIKIGNLILSPYPLRVIRSYRNYQMVKLERNGRNLILINVHFPSDITCFRQKSILSHLILELEQVKKENPDSEFLLAGDFNLLSWSKEIQALQRIIDLLPNQQYTFPSNYPLVKYDYVFHSGFQTEPTLDVKDLTFSDHTPMVIQIN